MTDKPWLDYDGQSTPELLELAKTHREDSIVVAFETALLTKERDERTEEEQVVLAVEAMEREVENGGFDQFFVNAESGAFAPILVESLKKIGCPKTAALAARAIEALGLRHPFDAEGVEAAMQVESIRRDRALEAIDREYYDGDEPIASRLLAFIRANAAKITLP